MIKYLQRREAVYIHASYVESQTQLDLEEIDAIGDEDYQAFKETTATDVLTVANRIFCAKRVHKIDADIDFLIQSFPAIDVISPFIRYFINHDDSSAHWRHHAYYSLSDLPHALRSFDIWKLFKLHSKPPNHMYAVQQKMIWCSLTSPDQPAIADTVLVEMDPAHADISKRESHHTTSSFHPER
jgi:hypothetical protein